jgi:iron complex transport system permease protein
MNSNKRKNILKSKTIIIAALIIAAAAFAVSLCTGKYTISAADIAEILSGSHGNQMSVNVFYKLRLPRTMMTVLAGAGLSTAGFVFQSVFKNPLASPDIIGVTTGANAGAAFCIVFLSGNMLSVVFGSFTGAILALVFVLALVRMSGSDNILTYVLSGIVIGAVSSGAIMVLKYFSDPENQLGSIEYWTMGSLGGMTSDKLKIMLPFFIIGMAGLYLMRWQIFVLSLSDEEGMTLGIPVERSRYMILFFSALVVGSVVSVTGLISFVGLIPPHIARSMLKKNDIDTLILSGITGGILLTLSDCLSRILLLSELPISIITSFIGAPYLAALVIRQKKI